MLTLAAENSRPRANRRKTTPNCASVSTCSQRIETSEEPGARDRQSPRTEKKDFGSGLWDPPRLSDLVQHDTLPMDTCLQVSLHFFAHRCCRLRVT
jgi:hypothetical protein